MTVEIFHINRSRNPGVLARFAVEVDGWRIYGCSISRAEDGFLVVAGPRGPSKKGRAIEPPRDVWLAVVAAALEAYRDLPDETETETDHDDAGLRRVIGETCEAAGL